LACWWEKASGISATRTGSVALAVSLERPELSILAGALELLLGVLNFGWETKLVQWAPSSQPFWLNHAEPILGPIGVFMASIIHNGCFDSKGCRETPGRHGASPR
jgi:hypothetical protein